MSRYIILVAVLVIILGAHATAVSGGYYNTYWWLDIVLHMAGGAWVAGASFVYLKLRRRASIFLSLCVFAVVWETLEFFLNTPFFGVGEAHIDDPLWILDTIKDFIVGISAGWIMTLLLIRQNRYNKTNA